MRRAPQFVLALYAALIAWIAVAASWDTLHRYWTSDDAFFYLTIARNIARGHGSTFDGLSVTNGYQPLWLAAVAALFRITGALTPETGARVVMILSGGCVVGGIAIIARAIDRLAASPIVTTAATLALLGAVGFSFFGLEAHLSVAMTGLVFAMSGRRWLSAGHDSRQPPRCAVPAAARLGIAVGLLALTRLDLAIWALAILPALAALRRMAGWSRLDIVCTSVIESGCAGAIVAAYLIVNRALFGLWLPISAVLRSRPAGIRIDALSPAVPLDYVVGVIMIGLPLAMLVVACRAAQSRGLRETVSGRLGFGAALAYGALAHTMAVGLFAAAVEWRYLVTSSCALVMIGAIVATEWIAASSRGRSIVIRSAIGTGAIGIALMLALLATRRAAPPPASFERSDLTHFSQAMSQAVSTDAVIFGVDLTAEPGWFCDCHLINGDGVVNDWSFQRFVRERRLKDYLDAKGVEFVIVKANDADSETMALRGWDWRSIGAEEFPIQTFARSSAVLGVGRFYLFRWPHSPK